MNFSDSYLPFRMILIVGCLGRGESWFKLLLFFFLPLSSKLLSTSSTPPYSPKNMGKKENRAKDEGKRSRK